MIFLPLRADFFAYFIMRHPVCYTVFYGELNLRKGFAWLCCLAWYSISATIAKKKFIYKTKHKQWWLFIGKWQCKITINNALWKCFVLVLVKTLVLPVQVVSNILEVKIRSGFCNKGQYPIIWRKKYALVITVTKGIEREKLEKWKGW